MSKVRIKNYVIDSDPISNGWVPKKSENLFIYIASMEDEDCRSDFMIDTWYMLNLLIAEGFLTGEQWYPPKVEIGDKSVILTLSSRHNKNKHVIIYEDLHEKRKR